MLISEFSKRSGLTPDTVRFYVRLGLLRPEASSKGGAHPYQLFTSEHLRAAKIIRTAQSLGMSLKEMGAISAERRAGRMTRDRSIGVLQRQLDQLEIKTSDLTAMRRYLQAKIEWMKEGERGSPPDFEVYRVHTAASNKHG